MTQASTNVRGQTIEQMNDQGSDKHHDMERCNFPDYLLSRIECRI